jgi:hypothetical protein
MIGFVSTSPTYHSKHGSIVKRNYWSQNYQSWAMAITVGLPWHRVDKVPHGASIGGEACRYTAMGVGRCGPLCSMSIPMRIYELL